MSIALIDCDNFFVSCERLFKPNLIGKPVVVGSGCIVARSNEAKALGIKMGQPYFQIKHLRNLITLKPRLGFYQTLSKRVMKIIEHHNPKIEIYSIDEAFIDCTNIENLDAWCDTLRQTIMLWSGIPVSIGIGTTKTQAKIAVLEAKKSGIAFYNNEKYEDLELGEIWGIGSRLALKLKGYGLRNLSDFIQKDPRWIRKVFGLPVERIYWEIKGLKCFPIDLTHSKDQKSMRYVRVFNEPIVLLHELEKIISQYLYEFCKNLRAKNLYTNCIDLLLEESTSFERARVTIQLADTSNDVFYILPHIKSALQKIYKKGTRYRRAGIIGFNLSTNTQKKIWERPDKLSQVMDELAQKYKKPILFPASSIT